MNWLSMLEFALAALNFCLMILSVLSNSWAFVINLAAVIFCLIAGIAALDK